MILCYITWGDNAAIYSECVFSILSYLADDDVEEICVITEKPEYYAMLSGRVNVVHCSAEQMHEWGGTVIPCKLKSPRAANRPYSFRHKIKAVEKVVELYPQKDILYLDSDTYRAKPLAPVREELSRGNAWLHTIGGRMCRAHTRVNKEVYELFKGKTFDGYTVDENTCWYNSGAVGLPGSKAKDIIESTVRINDEIYDMTGFYSCEELAFSFGLAKHAQVFDSGDIIGHYWGNEGPWVEMITLFLSKCHMQNLGIEEQSRLAAGIDPRILPLYIHHPTRRKQLLRFVNKYFPLKRPRYFPEKSEEW